jgi:hypothetical protein
MLSSSHVSPANQAKESLITQRVPVIFLKDPANAGISLIIRGKTLQVQARTCNCMACLAEK